MVFEREGSRSRLGGVASLTGVGVLFIFIVQNTQDVRFHFLFLDFTWPLWLYTIVVALFGALVWFGLGVMRRHRRRQERRADRERASCWMRADLPHWLSCRRAQPTIPACGSRSHRQADRCAMSAAMVR